jgi:hypothetical protein
MVDIGANTGFYGELAIFHGCDAVFADMQPACVRWIQATLLVNALSAHGAIIPYGISDKEESIGRLNFTEHDCNIKYHLPQLWRLTFSNNHFLPPTTGRTYAPRRAGAKTMHSWEAGRRWRCA